MTAPPAAALGLAPEDLEALLVLLAKHAPEAGIWAFGSRVAGRARPFSDLDVALIQDRPLDSQARAELGQALSESRLPFKVDLVEWSRLDDSFRQIIRRDHVVLKPAKKRRS